MNYGDNSIIHQRINKTKTVPLYFQLTAPSSCGEILKLQVWNQNVILKLDSRLVWPYEIMFLSKELQIWLIFSFVWYSKVSAVFVKQNKEILCSSLLPYCLMVNCFRSIFVNALTTHKFSLLVVYLISWLFWSWKQVRLTELFMYI